MDALHQDRLPDLRFDLGERARSGALPVAFELEPCRSCSGEERDELVEEELEDARLSAVELDLHPLRGEGGDALLV